MKNALFFFPFISILLVSCKPTTDNKGLLDEISTLKKEVAHLKSTQAQAENKKQKVTLVHAVFFQLKDNLTDKEIQTFMDAIKSLEKIAQTIDLKTGKLADTGDPRLAKDYNAALIMGFENQEALAIYEKDTFHAQVRKDVGKFLAKAPVVYDFWLEK